MIRAQLVWAGACALAACGPTTGHSTGGGGGMRDLHAVHEQDERARLCTAVATLHAAACAPFDATPADKLDDCSIVDHVYLAGYDACLPAGGSAAACDAVQACVSQIDAGSASRPYAGPLRGCSDPTPTIPAGVSADEAAARYGLHDKTFADSPSTLKQPIEVCGGPAELDYLMRVTCTDGSHAFPDRATAVTTGLGPVGPGGRCGRVVDHFVAPCAEHGYDIYMDPYRCPGG